MALFLILEKVVGSFLSIWWVQCLIQKLFLSTLIGRHASLRFDQRLLTAELHTIPCHHRTQLIILIGSEGTSLIVLSLWIRLISFGVDDLGTGGSVGR